MSCRMKRCRVVRCRSATVLRWSRLFRQLGLAVSGNVLLAACAPAVGYRTPSSLGGYDILITRDDSLSREIGRGLKRRGYTVRGAVKGGSAATAYVLLFTQRDTDIGAPTWLYVRLADTRSGAIVAAVAAPLDSLGATPEARARAIVDSLTQQPPLRPPI